MDSAFGRILLANQNAADVGVTAREGVLRYRVPSRSTRSERLDATAKAAEYKYIDPKPLSYQHMAQIRLEPRMAPAESVAIKNMSTTGREAFQDLWRAPIV